MPRVYMRHHGQVGHLRITLYGMPPGGETAFSKCELELIRFSNLFLFFYFFSYKCEAKRKVRLRMQLLPEPTIVRYAFQFQIEIHVL